MRFNPVPLMAAALLCAYTSFAQVDERYRVTLNSGSFIPEKNITAEKLNSLVQQSRTGGKSFLLIQFESIPTETARQQLSRAGVELLEYIPNNIYTAVVTGNPSPALLTNAKARSVVQLDPKQKMEPTLAMGIVPNWAQKVAGAIDTWISYPLGFDATQVVQELKSRNFEVIPSPYQQYRIVYVRVATARLNELAALPFVEYVQAAPKEDEPLNNNSFINSKANVLGSNLASGRKLHGEGVVIGVGDDSNPMNHIDFAGRIFNHNSLAGGNHGLHVMGTAAGAGIVYEQYHGYAPKSTIVSQAFSNILAYAPVYVQDYGMVITNNSYGNVINDCKTFGVYDLYSRVMDLQAFQMPNLQHVFAAGNSGLMSCAPYPTGFGTVLGSYQSSKNTISVANITQLGALGNGSSRGPVRDGRIKPEIAAQGSAVLSTYPINSYGYNNGTSMAAPAVSGGLALLYQRYRELHGGTNPQNGLMKALLLNGATDIGNEGPDYTYGFGWLNLLRSVTMLENNNYLTASVSAGGSNTHTITVPAGSSLAQMKVMLYWNDSAAAAFASRALVNDLDLEVLTPSATTVYPQLLDTLPSKVNDTASTGPDHFNNVEQVVIKNPVAGTYTFTVKGTTIPLAGQHSYYLVYDTIPVSLTITSPVGKERLENNEAFYISWDAFGNPTNDFKLEYTTDNGGTWNTITNNAAANARVYLWTTPTGVATDLARVRISQNGTSLQSVSDTFTIVGKPVISLSATQCPGYIAINWPAVTGATDYEVMLLSGDEMIVVGTTTATNYAVGGLRTDLVYYIEVRARINGTPGRRSLPLTVQPNTGTCVGSISDNDVKAEAIISPASSGRQFTSTELPASTNVTLRIRNLDDVATTGNIQVTYVLDANAPVTQTITAPAIAGGGFLDYTFPGSINLSAVGSYNLTVYISYPGDVVNANDTIRKVFKQLDNAAINLATPFIDNIEAAPVQSHTSNQMGLTSLDRYDFYTSTQYGRIRSFVSTGIAYSGTKALTLDADRFNAGGTTDSLTGTFNLAAYDTLTDDVRLDFRYKHHGEAPNAANNLWIRGSDTSAWILAYDLYANQTDPGKFKLSSSIELRNLLKANNQNFSSSMQARWGQWGQILAADNETAAGYTFDDIRLYRVTDDIQMIAIDTPLVSSCNLNSTVPVRIRIRNSSNAAVNNIPVFFSVDMGVAVPETIPTIPANTIITYQFTATADLSATGPHNVTVWSDLASDNFADNDSATVNVYNSQLVSSFPYLQNFESTDGGWYTAGTKSSWAYGTPASPKVNGAASGIKAWKTNLAGTYNDSEASYLYSPCFNIAGLSAPMLSFNVALDLEDCGSSLCDAAYIEYSADGVNWRKLDSTVGRTNWYNRNYSGNQVWSVQDYTRWHVASIPLPPGLSQLRLRFVLNSDPYVAREGIAIDDIHIFDKIDPIYEGSPFTSSVVTQSAVSGSSWINFVGANGIIAAVNPVGQTLGNTDAQVYINTGGIRNRAGQYYHNRNITIKPANTTLADSVLVRFYFLDSETETLINATGCGLCSKPSMAKQLGVSKFTSTTKSIENGDLADNSGGTWLFIPPSNVVKVPYDRGYYAEYKVKDFSEFWLNNGGPNANQSLPVELTVFTARKASNGDALLEWTTASENNTARFEIELAKGDEEYRANHFNKIGEVRSAGNSSIEKHYQFADAEAFKSGVRYYRLKIVDLDGRFTYSAVRPLIYDDQIQWQVYPNPSSGIFNAIYQSNAGDMVTIRVLDANGKELIRSNAVATGFQQRTIIDLGAAKYTSGMYLIQIVSGSKLKSMSVLKK